MQVVARRVLRQCNGSALTIRIVAGVLRCGDEQNCVRAWQRIASEFEQALGSADGDAVSDYQRPLQAYRLSICSKVGRAPERGAATAHVRTLLGALDLFKPTKRVPVEVLRCVWCACCGEGAAAFDVALRALTAANLVDREDFRHHSCTGGAPPRSACASRQQSARRGVKLHCASGIGSALHTRRLCDGPGNVACFVCAALNAYRIRVCKCACCAAETVQWHVLLHTFLSSDAGRTVVPPLQLPAAATLAGDAALALAYVRLLGTPAASAEAGVALGAARELQWGTEAGGGGPQQASPRPCKKARVLLGCFATSKGSKDAEKRAEAWPLALDWWPRLRASSTEADLIALVAGAAVVAPVDTAAQALQGIARQVVISAALCVVDPPLVPAAAELLGTPQHAFLSASFLAAASTDAAAAPLVQACRGAARTALTTLCESAEARASLVHAVACRLGVLKWRPEALTALQRALWLQEQPGIAFASWALSQSASSQGSPSPRVDLLRCTASVGPGAGVPCAVSELLESIEAQAVDFMCPRLSAPPCRAAAERPRSDSATDLHGGGIIAAYRGAAAAAAAVDASTDGRGGAAAASHVELPASGALAHAPSLELDARSAAAGLCAVRLRRHIAGTMWALRQFDGAVHTLCTGLRVACTARGASLAEVAACCHALGLAFAALPPKRHSELTLAAYEASLACAQSTACSEGAAAGHTRRHMAAALLALQRPREAAKQAALALQCAQQACVTGEVSLAVAEAHAVRAAALEAAGCVDKALQHYECELQARLKLQGDGHATVAEARRRRDACRCHGLLAQVAGVLSQRHGS